jgi:hypothetical protein
MPTKKAACRLDAGALSTDIELFELRLMSENRSPRPSRTYAEAARWLAAEGLRGHRPVASRLQGHPTVDVQWWFKRLLADQYAHALSLPVSMSAWDVAGPLAPPPLCATSGAMPARPARRRRH